MSESAFGNDLDALVRGEHLAPNDELTRFASDLYAEEKNVTMPNVLKLRIAHDLGLPAAEEPTTSAAPVSRRTTRAAVTPPGQSRNSRPWVIALTIAAAILLALTGIVRLGIPMNNNEPDNQFLLAPSAVPTISATPAATPDGVQPVSAEECREDQLIDRGEWMQLQNDRAASHDESVQRVDEPYSLANDADAEAVADRQGQSMACINRGGGPEDRADSVLPVESPRRAWEMQVDPETNQAILEDRLERGKELSLWVEQELGLTPADLVYPTDRVPGLFWPPSQAIEMGDGRLALLPGWLVMGEESPSSIEFYAPVWIEVDGEWLFEEDLFFCIGECEEYWEQIQSAYPNLATPVASAEASPAAELAACAVDGFVPDYQVQANGHVNMWPEPGISQGVAITAVAPGTAIMWLCESEPSSDPEGDQLDEDQVWMLFRTEDGTEGWIREIDVHEMEP